MASQKERESGILQIEQREDVASQKEKKGRLRHRKRRKEVASKKEGTEMQVFRPSKSKNCGSCIVERPRCGYCVIKRADIRPFGNITEDSGVISSRKKISKSNEIDK